MCIWNLHQLYTTLTPGSIHTMWSKCNKFESGVKWVYLKFTPIKHHFDTDVMPHLHLFDTDDTPHLHQFYTLNSGGDLQCSAD